MYESEPDIQPAYRSLPNTFLLPHLGRPRLRQKPKTTTARNGTNVPLPALMTAVMTAASVRLIAMTVAATGEISAMIAVNNRAVLKTARRARLRLRPRRFAPKP